MTKLVLVGVSLVVAVQLFAITQLDRELVVGVTGAGAVEVDPQPAVSTARAARSRRRPVSTSAVSQGHLMTRSITPILSE